MIDYENIRLGVAKGLKEYCGIPVVRSNQTEELAELNIDTYLSYTITTLKGENKGSYGVYEDGTKRKPVPHIWSVSAVSPDDSKSVMYACKAHEWFDTVGNTFLTEIGAIVESVGSVTNRDNILTYEYQHKKGFDVFFTLFDVIEGSADSDGVIETAEIGGISAEIPLTTDELNSKLEKRLDGEVI